MQITKARLKQIIQEEFSRMNEISSEPVHIDVNSNETDMGRISEDGHTDVSSAIRSMKLIIEDASEILEGLMQISKNGELPSWWMNKVAVAKKDLNSCRDYFLVSEEAKPDFLDLDKDGDEEEPMKKAAKEAEQQNESLSNEGIKKPSLTPKEDFRKLYNNMKDDIFRSDLDKDIKTKIRNIIINSDLGKEFEPQAMITDPEAVEAAKKSRYDSPYLGASKPYQESQSPSDDLLETLIRKQLQKKTKISEALSLHIKKGVGIERNIFRPGSDSYFALISEARRQYKNGDYSPINEEELELLESNVGEFGIFEGEKVPLDFPMYVDDVLEERRKRRKTKKKKTPPIGKPTKNTESGKKYKVFVRDPKTGNVRKITYGDSKGGLKGNWNNAEARASFAARHNCAEKSENPNRRLTAGYWACRAHKDFGKNVPGRFW